MHAVHSYDINVLQEIYSVILWGDAPTVFAWKIIFYSCDMNLHDNRLVYIGKMSLKFYDLLSVIFNTRDTSLSEWWRVYFLLDEWHLCKLEHTLHWICTVHCCVLWSWIQNFHGQFKVSNWTNHEIMIINHPFSTNSTSILTYIDIFLLICLNVILKFIIYKINFK